MVNKNEIILENIYGMLNFYKPGWHFDINTNLMVTHDEGEGEEEKAYNGIRDIKKDICDNIIKEGKEIQDQVNEIN